MRSSAKMAPTEEPFTSAGSGSKWLFWAKNTDMVTAIHQVLLMADLIATKQAAHPREALLTFQGWEKTLNRIGTVLKSNGALLELELLPQHDPRNPKKRTANSTMFNLPFIILSLITCYPLPFPSLFLPKIKLVIEYLPSNCTETITETISGGEKKIFF